jgi:hypothetical protein
LGKLFDTSGLGFITLQIKSITGNNGLAMGSSEFDQSKPPIVFKGLPLSTDWIRFRIGAFLYPIPLLFLALLLFHRFDPVRLKRSIQRKHRSLPGLINEKLKFLTRWIPVPGQRRMDGNTSLWSSIIQDTLLTLRLYPVITLIAVVLLVISTFASPAKVLPVAFGVIIIAISDMGSREKRMGLLTTVFAMPSLKPNFVIWKFGSALLLILAFTLIPLVKFAFLGYGWMLSLVIGCLFTAAMATCFGILTSNPKTFIVLFGMFWYLVLNDGGKNPTFDFAGWYGIATTEVRIVYLGLAAGVLALTYAVHAYQMKRSF